MDSAAAEARTNWITNVMPPKIRSLLRRESPENCWVKCPESGRLVHHRDLANNLFVVPDSDYHMRVDANTRMQMLFDAKWDEIKVESVLLDPLKFRDEKRYIDKLKEARSKTGLPDAVKLGFGQMMTRDRKNIGL